MSDNADREAPKPHRPRNIFEEDGDLREAWHDFIGALVSTYVCQPCKTFVGDQMAAAQHELRHHEGAQTCWTYAAWKESR